jgi:hypothetical protein
MVAGCSRLNSSLSSGPQQQQQQEEEEDRLAAAAQDSAPDSRFKARLKVAQQRRAGVVGSTGRFNSGLKSKQRIFHLIAELQVGCWT